MKTMKFAILTSTLIMSSLAFAEGGGDRTFARMAQAREVALSVIKPSASVETQEDVAQQKPATDKKQPHC
ncbi:hypothetical protein BWR59_19760 [Pseudomonas sp. Bc-h]|uniref:co-regulatory protein PtrA N-terminal domain-containing protein n=1 Tax=Pseudomonas sp. Bc-h TaxID=1943632 RepID=UPI0009D9ECA2|nr:co-regulatory protein PtrA N-terminal domain-containing protein [Pseudomonas sp. Bc-h]OQR29701.1 hypothetical protein BWR59_19760 [Pseudomonas sp. Bc-h]